MTCSVGHTEHWKILPSESHRLSPQYPTLTRRSTGEWSSFWSLTSRHREPNSNFCQPLDTWLPSMTKTPRLSLERNAWMSIFFWQVALSAEKVPRNCNPTPYVQKIFHLLMRYISVVTFAVRTLPWILHFIRQEEMGPTKWRSISLLQSYIYVSRVLYCFYSCSLK